MLLKVLGKGSFGKVIILLFICCYFYLGYVGKT